jgi:hypothetical protein
MIALQGEGSSKRQSHNMTNGYRNTVPRTVKVISRSFQSIVFISNVDRERGESGNIRLMPIA